MKTRNMIFAALCTAILSLGFALTATAAPGDGIVGTAHDLSNMVAGEERICAFCHTPHHAVELPGVSYAPLWSRSDSDQTAYAQYDSATFDAKNTSAIDQLAGPSRLCMSCHDGVVAVDSYYGKTGTTTLVGDDTWGGYGVGLTKGLSNDHPIGFSFDAALVAADGELKDPTATDFIGNAGMKVADALYQPVPIPGGPAILTCASCHDVHNTDAVDDYFLYGVQADSGICLSCHDK